VTIDVQPWCSGVELLKLLSLLGIGLALAVRRIGVPWKVALAALAAMTALEMNIGRVAASSIGFEMMGQSFWTWKETVAGAATALGTIQVVELAWRLSRRKGEV